MKLKTFMNMFIFQIYFNAINDNMVSKKETKLAAFIVVIL